MKIEAAGHALHGQIGYIVHRINKTADGQEAKAPTWAVYFADHQTHAFTEQEICFCPLAERALAPAVPCFLCLYDNKPYDGTCEHFCAGHIQKSWETPFTKAYDGSVPVQIRDAAHPQHGLIGYLCGRGARGEWQVYLFSTERAVTVREDQLRIAPEVERKAAPARDCMICLAEGDELHPPNGGCQWVCKRAVSRHVVCIVCIDKYATRWGNTCCICDRRQRLE